MVDCTVLAKPLLRCRSAAVAAGLSEKFCAAASRSRLYHPNDLAMGSHQLLDPPSMFTQPMKLATVGNSMHSSISAMISLVL